MKFKPFFLLVALSVFVYSCKDETTSSSPSGPSSDNKELAKTTTVSEMPRSPKRGVSFNITNLNDAFLLSNCISWYYNWGNSNLSDEANTWLDACDIDFCPMCWSGSYNPERIRNFVQAHPNTKYLLGFNEPNLTDQANMTPSKAAELWPAVVALAKELNLKLGAPAMNYGTLSGYSDPIKWLDEFFRQPGVSIDDIYCIPIHCYMMSPAAVQGYVEKFYKYNKPIWMTEFCAWESISNVETQKQYMSAVINYFEANPKVERYAWFMPRMSGSLNSKPYNQLLTKGETIEWTPLGEIFNGLSSQDKSVCINASGRIPAHWYTEFSTTSPTVLNSTDTLNGEKNKLMIYNFAADRYVQYQVHATTAKSKLQIRYATVVETQMAVYIDGEPAQVITLPSTGSMNNWETLTVKNISLSGKHYVRFDVLSGAINFSWFRFND